MAQRYDIYKDSGVQWLGEIPGHWGCVAIGRVTNVILGKMLQNEPKGNTDTLTPYLCAKDVHFDGVDVSDLKQMYFSDTDLIHYAVQQGDMLIVEGGAGAGNCAILRQTTFTIGIQNSIMIVRGGEKIDNSYTCYFLSNIVQKGYVDFITNVATIPHFTKEKVCRTSTPLPPLPEQHAIVSYLDDKCGKIDEWIEKKQKEVELLQELKQRAIADAVTRGINPNVTMKQTNIPWLPEVPNNWEMVRVKALFENIREKNNPIQTEDRLSLSIDKGVTLYSEKTTNLDRFKEDCTQYLLARQNDIVLNSMNMIVGAVGKSKYFGCVSPAYYVIRLRDLQNQIDYYSLLLNIQKIRDVYRILGKGIMAIDRGDGKVNTCRLKVPYDDFGAIKVPVPPIEEQKQIVDYITVKTSKIDKLIANINKEIEGIKEYKQRLISDVVTGQIKVC